MPPMHIHPLQVYYEDTDHTGVVYHANYLKFFERAREHFIGIDELKRMLLEDGIGFVVYEVRMKYRKSAVFGDKLEVRTHVTVESEYRLAFHQNLYRQGSDELVVEAVLQLVCVDSAKVLVPVPEQILAMLDR
jgi:acyl-CoA thioester hydrolase